MTVNDVCDVEHPNLKSLQDIIEAAEDMENPKAGPTWFKHQISDIVPHVESANFAEK